MTYQEFIDSAIDYANAHPEQTFGLALMNALFWCRSDIYWMPINIRECSNPTAPIIYAWFYEVESLW